MVVAASAAERWANASVAAKAASAAKGKIYSAARK